MRETLRAFDLRHLAWIVLLVVGVAASTAAQDAEQVPASSAQFLAVDVFGGIAEHGAYGSAEAEHEEDRQTFGGFDVGASVRPVPWLGITGTVGRTWQGDMRLMHYLAGPRLTTSYEKHYGVRGFAHVLVGLASIGLADLPAQNGFEIAAGAGFDFLYFIRLQFDYLRLPSGVRRPTGTLLPPNQVRGVLAGVVPLCLRGCRPHDQQGMAHSKDGIDLSK